MRLTALTFHQELPIELAHAWDFFSSPYNLNLITPDNMSFEILTDVKNKKMYAGMLIQYRIKPFTNIPMNWVTEITQIKNLEYFIDEQRFGPYAMWHHQHHFKATNNGVLMTDVLHYGIPFGPIGKLANSLYVNKKVNEIFAFRRQKLNELFPSN